VSERSNGEPAARDVLAAALVECRATLSSKAQDTQDGRVELIDELLQRLEEPHAPGDSLADWLAGFAGPEEARKEMLADVVSLIARGLAPDDEPPSTAGAAELWQALVILVDHLFGSGVEPMGRLPFISDRLLELLTAEARNAGRRVDRAGEAGRVLANLAVSRKLRDAVATAVGFPVATTYRAVYLYDIPRSHVRTHVDTHDYEVVFHLILDHAVPGNEPGSALVVHRVGEASARRVRLQPGEAVALRGRGMIHSWEPMGPQEHRTLIAIGFQPADAAIGS
jgi:hypothetical protein